MNLINDTRKTLAEWLLNVASSVYPESKEKEHLEKCLLTHASFILELLKEERR